MHYIKKIIELCKSKNINLVIYIPPHYSEHYYTVYTNRTNDLIKFKKELSKIVNYTDFSGINSISIDKNNYYDYLHLRECLTDKIFAKVFNKDSIEVPGEFGVLVTSDNIDKHLEDLNQQINKYDLGNLKKVNK